MPKKLCSDPVHRARYAIIRHTKDRVTVYCSICETSWRRNSTQYQDIDYRPQNIVIDDERAKVEYFLKGKRKYK